MPFRVIVDIDTHSVLQEIEGLSERVGGGLGADWAGPALSMEIAAIEREWFESRGGGSWPPLAPSTIVARANRWGHYAAAPGPGVGPTGPILQWTTRLKESLGDPFGRGAGDAIVRMSSNRLEQGTLVPYAAYHMNTRPPVKTLTVEDQERLVEVFRKFVLEETAA